MLDSVDVVDAAEPGDAAWLCGNERFEVAVGFALRDGGDDVKWAYLALRCLEDGLMGVYADWKISYGPSLHLIEQV